MPCRDHVVQVCTRRKAFKEKGVRIVVVSFTANLEWAERWLEETCQAFPMLLDPERDLYESFGLERSLLRAWNPRTLLRYAREILRGRELKGIQGDSAQLGGDFLVDEGGILRFAYKSHDPTDRPSVEELLLALDELENS
ncbi:MAG: SelL-related redox protein [Anaerolineales bacterium]